MKYSIKIQGGLGNQLFQWAHGVFLENRGAQVYYDMSFYEKKKWFRSNTSQKFLSR